MEKSASGDPPLSQCPEPIAIVGMGCRWPGGVHNASQLWEMLKEKRSGWSEFKKDRINVDGFHHPVQDHPGSFHMRGGFFLEEDPRLFDNNLFRINAVETKTMDPAQRKLLEVTYEAFENAGEPWERFAGSRTGVFVGNFMSDHQNMQFRDPDYPMPYSTTGGDIAIHSNRINYTFDLRGPSLTVDTACSSALYALHMAVSGIRNGDCDGAIVAGSNLISDPGPQMFITKLGALSPTSISHTFDAAADGYARAEGVGALYIMPLSRAVAGSYPIRAVIRGTAINANGQSEGISYPSPTGQEAVIRQAYRNAGGLDPSLTGYFEAHGTGTPVGDPIEVSAIGRVFANYRGDDAPLLIGSIKPNLGHSESASAIASIMKVVMAIEKGEIPPTRGIAKLNPNIDFQGSRTQVAQTMTSWPELPIRRASVNSFGYGGANAHVILDHVESVLPGYGTRAGTPPDSWVSVSRPLSPFQASSQDLEGRSKAASDSSSSNGLEESPVSSVAPNLGFSRKRKRLHLLPFSANDDQALKGCISAVGSVASKHNVAEIAHTLATRRSRFTQRAFVVAHSSNVSKSLESASVVPFKCPRGTNNRLAFVFTGQGAQWPSMGRGLFNEYKAFQASIKHQDQILSSLTKGPLWRIEDILINDDMAHMIHESMVSQTVCTALQIALVELLASFGVSPTATVGHSSGEIAAAYAAGRLTVSEAIVLAYFRGYTVSKNERKGSMLAVGLGPAEVITYLGIHETDIRIAAINSPNSTTLSGEIMAIEQLASELQKEGIFNRILKTGGNAYHSHHMQALGNLYEEEAKAGLRQIALLAESELLKPQARWVSSVCPEELTEEMEIGPSYWRRNLESPVLFAQAIEVLVGHSTEELDVLLEIGPHPALSGPIKQITQLVKGHGMKTPAYLGSLKRGRGDLESILELGGNLFLHNVPVDIDVLNAVDDSCPAKAIPVDLPNYKYTYGPILFHENRLNKEWRLRKHPRHDLLGARQLGSTPHAPSWRNMLRLRDVPWLGDHRLIPNAIFPAAGFLAMAVEAAFQCHTDRADASPIFGFTFRNVAVSSALEVPDTEVGTDVVLNMQKARSSGTNTSVIWYDFQISSLNSETGSWIEHCTGLIKIESSNHPQRESIALDQEGWHLANIEEWYRKFRTLGLEYGPCFQALSNLKASSQRASADVVLTPTMDLVTAESQYPLHPASLDNCLQLANIAAYSGNAKLAKQAYIPVMFDELTIWNRQAEESIESGFAVAEGELRGPRGLYSRVQLCTRSGETLMDMNYFRGISYDGIPFSAEDEGTRPQDPFSRLVWKPDITTLSNARANELFPVDSSGQDELQLTVKLDKLFAYLIVDMCYQFPDTTFSDGHEHLEVFMKWIRHGYAKAVAEESSFSAEAAAATSMGRARAIDNLFEELDYLVEAKLIRKMYENMSSIFTGTTSGLEIALEDGLLADMYTSGLGVSKAYPLLQSLMDLLAHKDPKMKILEIGAGTGGATRRALSTLEAESSFKRYQEYTFSDLVPSFLSDAQRKFATSRGVKYSTLNIEQNPVEEQGFTQEYDLVISSQVLHTTENLGQTLEHVRKLLKPGGKLLLLELTKAHPLATFALGTFPYYWKGRSDRDADEPLLGRDRWHTELLRAGFSGIDIVLGEENSSVESTSVMLTTAVEPNTMVSKILGKPVICLITLGEPTAFGHCVAGQLQLNGFETSFLNASDSSESRTSSCISLIDLESSAALFKSEHVFGNMKTILATSTSMLWVSSNNIVHSVEPAAGLTVGLLRTVARETPHLRLAHLMVDSKSSDPVEVACQIVTREKRLLTEGNGSSNDDLEAFSDSCIHVSRLVPDTDLNKCYKIQEGMDTEARMARIGDLGPIRATTTRPGLLTSLQFEDDPDMLGPLPDDWVEIRSEAIDVNVKDLAVASGQFDLNTCSTACCGIVIKTGALVQHIGVGDRVCGFAPGNFGNFVRVPAIYQQRMELSDQPTDLASLPISYMTALYALKHLARVEQGESVLIQSAAGALGLATLRIARHLGAEIYVTVGSSAKVQLLEREFGIPRERIFSSRGVDSAKRIMTVTGGKGIDVVINSASGEHMQEYWRCIAPLGRFIEVGRLDILNHNKLPMEVFKRNATFSSFDIALVSKQRPQLGASLMAEVVRLYREGIIKPIDHITAFDISELQQAMMYMAKGTHVGKIVVTYENPDSLIKMTPSAPRAKFDPDAMYVLVGCIAGVGNSISNWMVERGARHLAYLSRSGPDAAAARELVERKDKQGVKAIVIKCDVTNKFDVEAAITKAASNRVIKGILHAAAVFEDVSFSAMEFSQLQRVLAPKVSGTMNLHEATLNQPLDFFTMTSSIVSVIGTATQASYSAANSFQDTFARFRLAQGLPARSLAMGMILDVGFASSREDIQRSLLRNGVYGTTEPEMIKLLDATFTAPPRLDDRFDPLAGAHLLVGLEPSKIYEADKKGVGMDFAWSSDPRFGRVVQAIQDHHEYQQSSNSKVYASDSAPALRSLFTLSQRLKSANSSAPKAEEIQELRGFAAEVVAERLAKLLFVPIEDVDVARDMASYGIDSMISAELRNWLFKTFGLDVSFVELVREGMTVGRLAGRLVDKLLGE
ncbi:hypothetical protein K491DRAFT_778066 [Lophiostoma macrostomum CBS 122681]|uniref:Uncharacterized protein n=1 Tax=Lophiostoma macrostomum CBS 122681 TaxID=1314788 RepID=A0A6A6T9A5_9PLEO|nr:hypothetical protein K491DRAFT_778066 [Lophiostoma macrostomum CBS 122681]